MKYYKKYTKTLIKAVQYFLFIVLFPLINSYYINVSFSNGKNIHNKDLILS